MAAWVLSGATMCRGNTRCATACIVLAAAVAMLIPATMASLRATDQVSPQYAAICDDMLVHAREAARLHNEGKPREADIHTRAVETLFKRATEMEPGEPQAYATMAVFYTNAHRFEDALRVWEKALERVSEDDREMQELIHNRIRHSRLGLVSTQRDTVYAQGHGNITLAIKLAREQVELEPSPTLIHDLATMLWMRAEVEPSRVQDALKRFRESQQVGFEAWHAAQVRLQLCERDRPAKLIRLSDTTSADSARFLNRHAIASASSATYASPGSKDVTFQEGDAFAYSLSNARINGKDAIVTLVGHEKSDAAPCALLLTTSANYSNLAKNVQMLKTWNLPASFQGDVFEQTPWHDEHRGQLDNHGANVSPRKARHVIKITDFASMSFYHWIGEALPRLVAALELMANSEGLDDANDAKLLLPKDHSGSGFISQFVDILVSAGKLDRDKVAFYDTKFARNDINIKAKKLTLIDWEPVQRSDGQPVHCVAPRSLLVKTRELFHSLEAATVDTTSQRPIAIFVTRKAEKMRQLIDYDEIRAELSSVVSPSMELVDFAGDAYTNLESIRLFRRASLVVGVHGGALSNILFAKPSTCVIELGFQSSASHHYWHMAAALDLDYYHIPLDSDERGMGAPQVKLSQTARQQLSNLVKDVVSSKKTASHDEL